MFILFYARIYFRIAHLFITVGFNFDKDGKQDVLDLHNVKSGHF